MKRVFFSLCLMSFLAFNLFVVLDAIALKFGSDKVNCCCFDFQIEFGENTCDGVDCGAPQKYAGGPNCCYNTVPCKEGAEPWMAGACDEEFPSSGMCIKGSVLELPDKYCQDENDPCIDPEKRN